MTKQYIYIYRYKKKNEKCAMIPVSSLHKCSHLYNNLESFLYFFYSCIALSFLRTNQHDTDSRSASSWLEAKPPPKNNKPSLSAPPSLGSDWDDSWLCVTAWCQTNVPTSCWSAEHRLRWEQRADERGVFMAQVGLGKTNLKKQKIKKKVSDCIRGELRLPGLLFSGRIK